MFSNVIFAYQCSNSTCRFERHSQTVTYPTLTDFYRYSTEVLEKLDDARHNVSYVKEKRDITDEEMKLLRDIQARDPLAEISEQEKEMVGISFKLNFSTA